jgi:signal peptidase I
MKRRLVTALWTLTVCAFALLVVKSFVADVYRVDSGSMRPTILAGRTRPDDERKDSERVLVRYDRNPEPARFDLVVTRSEHDDVPLVKRAAGLPCESVAVRDGDLFIDGRLLAPGEPRPARIPVYDDRLLDPEAFFHRREDGSVRREGDAWVVEAGPGAPGNRLTFHPALRDDSFDRAGRRVNGAVEVNDARLELAFRIDGALAEQRLRFQLVEAGDTFTLELSARAPGLRLTRYNHRLQMDSDEAEVLLERELVLPAERWLTLSFENIDNHLALALPELDLALGVGYAENVPLPGATSLAQHFGPRVAFGVESGRARFRAVRILRDLYYTNAGRYGTAEPVLLGPDEYFLLGDNSSVSTDSRQIGPIQARRLFGRPVAVLWPTPRWLHGAERALE